MICFILRTAGRNYAMDYGRYVPSCQNRKHDHHVGARKEFLPKKKRMSIDFKNRLLIKFLLHIFLRFICSFERQSTEREMERQRDIFPSTVTFLRWF